MKRHLLSDYGICPGAPVIDRKPLGDGARKYDWLTKTWLPFQKTKLVAIPMTIHERRNV